MRDLVDILQVSRGAREAHELATASGKAPQQGPLLTCGHFGHAALVLKRLG